MLNFKERTEIKSDISESLIQVKVNSAIAKEYLESNHYGRAAVHLGEVIRLATDSILSISILRVAKAMRINARRENRKKKQRAA